MLGRSGDRGIGRSFRTHDRVPIAECGFQNTKNGREHPPASRPAGLRRTGRAEGIALIHKESGVRIEN